MAIKTASKLHVDTLCMSFPHLQDVLPELESLRARLGEAKSALDKEQLKSADLENKCQQLEEDLKFKMSLLEKELVEVGVQ